MTLPNDHVRSPYAAYFPVKYAFDATRPSPRWKLFQGCRPRQKNRQAGLLGSGTRMGQALVKRLTREENARSFNGLHDLPHEKV